MNQLIKTLSDYVNKEMQTCNYTIKDYALRCDVSYSAMRKISNGQATDLMLSTIDRICNNSHFDLCDLIIKDISREEQLINNIYHQLKIYKEYR